MINIKTGQTKWVFLCTLLSFFVMSCTASEEHKKKNVPIFSPQDLWGGWTLIEKRYIKDRQSVERYNKNAQPDLPREWTAPVYLDDNGVLKPISPRQYLSLENQSLFISHDSIFSIHYPIHQYWKNNFKVDGNKLFIGKNKDVKSIWVSDAKDTLRISYLDFYGLYIEETYLKTSFDDAVLNILNDYLTNFPELAGTWYLIREKALSWGEQYELDFPHALPDSIVLSKEELEATLHTDRSVQMRTDGKKMKYFLGYKDGELVLIPGAWYDMEAYKEANYTNEDNMLFFSRKKQWYEE